MHGNFFTFHSGKSCRVRTTLSDRRGYYPAGSAGGGHYEYPTLGDRTASPTVASGRRRLPSLSSLSSARTGERSQSSSYVVTRRTGQGRRLPATPKHPSTLNIDALGNMSSSQQQQTYSSVGGVAPRASRGDRINFPKLDPSPSRPAIRIGAGLVRRAAASAGAMLPRPPSTSTSAGHVHGRPHDQDASAAVVSGRGGGGRQLPRVGPEHLAHAECGGLPGRRGASSGGTIRRELPRPGTTIGFR